MFGYCSINGSLTGVPDFPLQAPSAPIDARLATEATYSARLVAEPTYDTILEVEPG